MEGCVRNVLSKSVLKRLEEKAKDYMLSHGIVVRTPTDPNNADVVTHVAVTLFPSPVPRRLYRHAVDIQQDISLLIHRVSEDHTFLKQSLEQVVKVDDFTRRLWEIYDTVTSEGVSQPYSLGMLRSDYMFDCGMPDAAKLLGDKLDTNNLKLRQIEVNTMASSFGGVAEQMEGFHRFMLGRVQKAEQLKNIPPNPAAHVLGEAVAKAWELYGNSESVVLFLIQEDERNRYDQHLLECAIYSYKPELEVIRRSMADLRLRAKLTEDKRLVIDGYEVAVVYQRYLYVPQHYTCEEDWSTRLLIERSRAIKCPSAAHHLAGTKKIQQVLAKEGVMEKYISAEAAAKIRETFADQYSLDLNEEGDYATKLAMSDPHKFVLKPQREGGGNNTFGEDIQRVLSELGRTSERTAYILMQLVHATPHKNYMLRPGSDVVLSECVSEMGVFGSFVGTKDQTLFNRSGGHLLRTKVIGTNEGGVATGYSCLDSPFLVD